MPFSSIRELAHEQVVINRDEETGLTSIIAIHDTTLGPALGGCRMHPYTSDTDALRDALRLSRGMTYKAAAAGLDLGGGKAVILGDPKTEKSEALFRTFGRAVESLGGRYITAEDAGTGVADIEQIRKETSFVVGVDNTHGGSGDPSPVTARGVLHGMRAACEAAFGSDELAGRTVAIQGLGNVGLPLARLLRDEGAHIIASDVDPERIADARREIPKLEIAESESIFDADADIFAPCAMGSAVNDDTVGRIKARVVCGSANNQLDHDELGAELAGRGIVYAPDYLVNAGGLINVSVELEGYNQERALRLAESIYTNTRTALRIAREEEIPPNQAADRMAKRRIESMRSVGRAFPTFRRRRGRRSK